MNDMNTYPDEILVVDDTSASLKLLEDILSNAGYRVRLATGGELALRSAKIQPPALVLLDIRMPGMDGFEVCQRLKEDEKTRSVPIIFISILENEHEKMKAFQVGGVDYINKPIRATEVLARVHTHLSLRHAQLDLEARNIELEVARNTLEERVKERSAELEQTNRRLQQQIDVHLQTVEALKESEAKYRSLIRKVQTAIVLHDGQGQILDSNPLARELLGLSEDQLLGKALIDPEWRFLREDDTIMPVAEYPVSLVLSTQQPLRGYVLGINRPDKDDISWVLVNAEPEYDDSGKVALVIVSFVDITDRRSAEEIIAWNLAINQALSSLYIPLVTAGTDIEKIASIVLEKSRQLTGSAHGFVAEIDPATGDLIAHTNTKMIRTECKVAEEELRKIRFPQRADGLYNGLWGHALNTNEPFYTDVPAEHPASVGVPEGHITIERFLAVPVLLAGELAGQISLSNSTRPYTDRDLDAIDRIADFYALAIQHKRAEKKIRQLNQELEQRVIQRTAKLEAANKELEAFAYSVSHDLRAPLRHVDGFLELLQKKAETALDEQSRHYMNAISEAARKMGLLIDDLLSFSRMGRQAISFQQVDMETLVRGIIREIDPDAAGRDIAWRINDLPVVTGDRSMLRMVLVNLISNAVKFTRPCRQAEIEIGSMPGQASETVIFVRDNGVGFDMTYVDKLFGVFQRLHRAEEFEGTGIGLANVHRIIARHGGRTWAEGKPDQGATFYFSLPLSIQER